MAAALKRPLSGTLKITPCCEADGSIFYGFLKAKKNEIVIPGHEHCVPSRQNNPFLPVMPAEAGISLG